MPSEPKKAQREQRKSRAGGTEPLVRTPRPSIELVLNGEDVRPASVPLKTLGELLLAAAASLEAVAKTLGQRTPVVGVTDIQEGSARYLATAAKVEDDGAFDALVAEFETTLAKPPEGLPDAMRVPFSRLSKAGEGYQLGVRLSRASTRHGPKTLKIPPPSSYVVSTVERTATLHGEVYGVERLQGERYRILFKVEGGHKLGLDAPERLTLKAAELFNRTAVVRASYSWNMADESSHWTAESIAEWHDDDPLAVFGDIANRVAESGPVDPETLIARIRDGG